MRQRIKSAVVYIFQPKLIIFGLALYNFISLWIAAEIDKNLGALVSPWFQPWSYFNEPSLLLLSTSFLLFRKWWSNTISFLLSGFVLTRGIYLITRFGGWSAWFEYLSKQWQFIHEYEMEILKEWEVQIILAIIVFSFSIFYLIRDSFYRKTAQSRFA